MSRADTGPSTVLVLSAGGTTPDRTAPEGTGSRDQLAVRSNTDSPPRVLVLVAGARPPGSGRRSRYDVGHHSPVRQEASCPVPPTPPRPPPSVPVSAPRSSARGPQRSLPDACPPSTTRPPYPRSRSSAPPTRQFGDFATNLAMKLARPLRRSPLDIAESARRGPADGSRRRACSRPSTSPARGSSTCGWPMPPTRRWSPASSARPQRGAVFRRSTRAGSTSSSCPPTRPVR